MDSSPQSGMCHAYQLLQRYGYLRCSWHVKNVFPKLNSWIWISVPFFCWIPMAYCYNLLIDHKNWQPISPSPSPPPHWCPPHLLHFIQFAHRKCVQRWCNEKGDITCEICHKVTPRVLSVWNCCSLHFCSVKIIIRWFLYVGLTVFDNYILGN